MIVGASPQLTQEQTYRYVYYYYNYYAAMETQDTGEGVGIAPNLEHYGDTAALAQPAQQPHQHQQQYMDTGGGRQAAWPSNAESVVSNSDGGGPKRHMRGLFDEWRRKYEEWYHSTFGKSVHVSCGVHPTF